MALSFRELDLTPFSEPDGFGEFRVAASDDAIWVLLSRRLLRIDSTGHVQVALEPNGTDVFVQLSASGAHVAVATMDKALFVSRAGGTFAALRPPKKGRRTSLDSLFVTPDGSLWLGLGVGQPVKPSWWYRRPDGPWGACIDAAAAHLAQAYGLVGQPIQLMSATLGPSGKTVVGLDDWRATNPAAELDPEAPLYLRQQTLRELTPDGWAVPFDLAATGIPPIMSPKDPFHPTWTGGVSLALVWEQREPVWLVGRPDGLFRVWRGRAERIELAPAALVSDGDRSVLAVERVDNRSLLRRSRDAGRTFMPLPSMEPREPVLLSGGRSAATFFRETLVLGLVDQARRRSLFCAD